MFGSNQGNSQILVYLYHWASPWTSKINGLLHCNFLEDVPPPPAHYKVNKYLRLVHLKVRVLPNSVDLLFSIITRQNSIISSKKKYVGAFWAQIGPSVSTLALIPSVTSPKKPESNFSENGVNYAPYQRFFYNKLTYVSL